MNDQGHYVGSVSGGCVEESLIVRYRDGQIAGPTPTFVDFGVDRQQAARIDLPCGGRLEVLIEQIDEAKSITQLLAALERNDLVTRRVDIGTGVVSLSQGEGGLEFRMTDVEVCKTLGPAWQMLIVGDGQLARHLTSMAHQFDYGVTICDPRENYHVNRKTGRSAVHARDA